MEDKKFTGVVVNSAKDLIGCGSCYENAECLCSEIVNFVAEWRVFVRYGKIIDVRPYKGDWRIHYNPTIIENAVNEFSTAPMGYAIDFGVTDDGRTLLKEVNDGYALGSYGLYYPDYAKLLSARWAELTGTDDECDFTGERYDYYARKIYEHHTCEYIADDRGMHELWEEIQKMTDEERQKYIKEYEIEKQKRL